MLPEQKLEHQKEPELFNFQKKIMSWVVFLTSKKYLANVQEGGENDVDYRFNEIQTRLVERKDHFAGLIEKEIKKSRLREYQKMLLYFEFFFYQEGGDSGMSFVYMHKMLRYKKKIKFDTFFNQNKDKIYQEFAEYINVVKKNKENCSDYVIQPMDFVEKTKQIFQDLKGKG